MNWRNPFLITYLSVTVAGAGILGYLVYSGYSHYSEVATNYDDSVLKLRKLQNRIPFPSDENNAKYVEFTKQYGAEYDKLLAKIGTMQKNVEDVTPQAFQDLLRANVSQVEAAAKENGVTLAPGFYLGFSQYQGTLPPDSAAGPLARQLAAIRLVVDNLIQLKAKEITEIKRNPLPEEGSAAAAPQPTPPPRNLPGRPRPNASGDSKIVTANSFDVIFVANQSAVRAALDYIVNADQFFIIRYLNVQNSALDGPKKVEEANAQAQAAPTPNADAALGNLLGGSAAGEASGASAHTLRVLVGRELLTVALRIEMITFNNLTPKK